MPSTLRVTDRPSGNTRCRTPAMTMHPIAVIDALHRGEPLAAQISSADPSRLAWVGVYPLDVTRESTIRFLERERIDLSAPDTPMYRLRRFEVDRGLVDRDECIAEPN